MQGEEIALSSFAGFKFNVSKFKVLQREVHWCSTVFRGELTVEREQKGRLTLPSPPGEGNPKTSDVEAQSGRGLA